MNDSDVEMLKSYQAELGQRLAELEVRTSKDDSDALRALSEVFHAWNASARLLGLTEMPGPFDGILAEEMAPWINEQDHDGE